MNSTVLWVWLSLRLSPGSRICDTLLTKFGSIDEIYKTDEEALSEFEITSRTREALLDKNVSEAMHICEWCEKYDIRILTCDSEEYPKSLRAIDNYPPILYVRGNFDKFNQSLFISMVGTRRMTPYGKNVAYEFARDLAEAGACIVSGMALGNDSAAACGALDGGGATIAVLGCGIDKIYPPEHAHLYGEILENGAIITEFAPGTPPEGSNFPIRNRIISGLGQCTIVVEAHERSGALITARHALVQGRDLFAIPGPLGEKNSAGTNDLLKAGARLASNAEDILNMYEFMYPFAIDPTKIRHRRMDIAEMADESIKRHRIYSASNRNQYKTYGYGNNGGKAEEKPAEMQKKKTPAPPIASVTESKPLAYIQPVKKQTPAEKSPVKTPPAQKSSVKEKLFGKKLKAAEEKQGHFDMEILSDIERRIYEDMTDGVPVTADELVKKGYKISEALGALTILEVYGAIEAYPGGYFIKKT